jgi:hypothetical protein
MLVIVYRTLDRFSIFRNFWEIIFWGKKREKSREKNKNHEVGPELHAAGRISLDDRTAKRPKHAIRSAQK